MITPEKRVITQNETDYLEEKMDWLQEQVDGLAEDIIDLSEDVNGLEEWANHSADTFNMFVDDVDCNFKILDSRTGDLKKNSDQSNLYSWVLTFLIWDIILTGAFITYVLL